MQKWNYLSNTFLVVTDGSYRKCRKIADYTLNALQAQSAITFFDTLYNDLKPFVDQFKADYDAWLSNQGLQKSKTSTLTVMLKTLQSELIERWDIMIQVNYPQNNAEYIALLPHRRIPFQSGSQEDRIAALSALSIRLTGNASLLPVKTEVDATLADIIQAFNTQKSTISNTKVESTAVDTARIKLCQELYGVLGLLMHHFREHPEEADNYFDTQSIRNHEQVIFKHNLKGAELYLAMTHTFIAGEEVRLVNRGNTSLRFALCAEPNDSLGSTYVEVAALDEIIVAIDSLGFVSHRYFKVQNMSATEVGKYTIMLL